MPTVTPWPAPALDLAALGLAEDLGLITVDKAGVRFRHPLIGSALYHDAGFTHRAAAHRQLAGLLSGEPDRRAWHLGAAAMRPDEGISSMLTASAPGARRRGGGLAAALALERAAELSPDPDSKAQRLAAAAELAAGSGQTGWARDLADHALALTLDQRLRSRARYVTGWALAWSGRYGSGATALLSLARETAQGDPATAWNCLSLAAAAAYQSGAPADVAAVAGLLDRLPPDGDGDIAASRLWTLAVTGQAAPARALLSRLTGTADGHRALFHAGAAAWLLDQTPVATGLLGAAPDTLADPGARAADGGLLAPLGWAYLDAGRWDDALKLVGAAQGCPVTDVPPAAARLITATVEAARGNTRRPGAGRRRAGRRPRARPPAHCAGMARPWPVRPRRRRLPRGPQPPAPAVR